jgi:hypothetical protein
VCSTLGCGGVRYVVHAAFCSTTRYPSRSSNVCPCASQYGLYEGTRWNHGTRVAGELIVRGLGCLAEGWGMRATARVCAVAPTTVLHWLGEAAGIVSRSRTGG